ncbi:MAG TPA: beta-3-deoxy-D-manno-oct-2-ulosonic acid transferase [Burkholderiaceae bacterium]|nr:beta-3-deoxy-D-manno-oct-2-ulosonic acid transferase [Burkholderiaceae bacterium]
MAADVRVLRVEDGFLRSVGLGADLVAPLSWVVDSRGIYYDPARSSDLEALLQSAPFPPEVLARAARFRERLVAAGLTKYNVGAGQWHRPRSDKVVVLVPGQVERDASVRLGGAEVKGNLALLQAVRRARPHAHILYKPHPDVVAGLRAAGANELDAHEFCDEILTDVSMSELLPHVDEVHVLTSLAGFEALVRGKPVSTYGQPFYAGWGLTRDAAPIARRTRRLSLDALVAGVLLLYPRYASRQGHAISAEAALDELVAWREQALAQRGAWTEAMRMPMRLLLRWTVGRN